MENQWIVAPRANRWIALPAAIATGLFLVVGIFTDLTPLLVFHSKNPNLYEGYRGAAPFLLGAAIVAANVWVWSVIGPRTRHDPVRPYRFSRLVGPAIGLFFGSLFFAALFEFALIVIAFSTTDWFTF